MGAALARVAVEAWAQFYTYTQKGSDRGVAGQEYGSKRGGEYSYAKSPWSKEKKH